MKLLSQSFETPMTETLTWQTDTFVSENGTEMRVSVLDLPRRSLAPSYQFVDDRAARSLLTSMFGMSQGFQVPFWHYATKIGAALVGDTSVSLAPATTELRDGCDAIVYDRAGAYELVSIVNVKAGEATLAEPLLAKWTHAKIAPVWAMYSGDNAAITRGYVDADVKVSLTLTQLDFADPFLNPFYVGALTLFNGLPLLEKNAYGENFAQAFNTGATVIDYGAAIAIRSLWKHPQQSFSRNFLCNRFFNRADWQWWNVFLDYCKGSVNPFYLPTFRGDFGLIAQTANTITLEGADYDDFFPFAPFQQFALYDANDVPHYCTATASVTAGANRAVSINPPLPDGFAVAKVSLLLKVRIADDVVTLNHDGLTTGVTLNLRTVDA